MAKMAQKPRVRPFELLGPARTRQKGVKKGSKMAYFDPFLTHSGQNLSGACRFSLYLGRFRGLPLKDLKKGVKKGVKKGLFLTPFLGPFLSGFGQKAQKPMLKAYVFGQYRSGPLQKGVQKWPKKWSKKGQKWGFAH